MKSFKKIIALTLACLMLVSAFAACDSKEPVDTEADTQAEVNSGNGEQTTEVETEYMPDIAKNNYGEDFYLSAYGGSTHMRFLWAEDRDQNIVTEAVYDRCQKVEDYLGITIYGSTPPGNHEHYHESFVTSVKNKDGAVDLFIPNAYMAVPGIIEGGYCRDLKTLAGLDLEADYWNGEYMEDLALHDRYYLGYSNFNIAKTYLFTFNKDMLEKYSDALDESIYDSVRGYRWTLDKMISLANLVYIDATGDGQTADDTFGISGQQWIPFIPFLHASGLKLVDLDEKGNYTVSVYTEQNAAKTTQLVDKLKELASSDCCWLKYRIEDTPVVPITSGRTLMFLSDFTALEGYLEYDVNFGVLPYPMFDEAQKDIGYISLNYDGYLVVPTYLRNEQMVAETIELLSFYSDPVRIAVFEKMLGKQVADTPDDAEMLELIWDSLCSDFGLTYSTITPSLDGILYMIPRLTRENGTESIASYVKSLESSANKAIEKYMKKLAKIGG
ncbi:MAG: extracellular solute-binding protein [Clostridia bacterium]|nr:extracellular solute-binding protein [Clostridia bacterium]